MRGLTDVYFLISLDKLCLPLHIHGPLNPTIETLKPHLYLQTAVPEKSSQRCCNLHKDKLLKGRQVVGSLTAPVCMPEYPRAVS